MAVTEPARHDLHTYFEETMGRERAGTLMELLPPVGWGDVATRQDLAHLREWASQHFDRIHATMATKAEMANLRTELRTEMAELRTELCGGMAEGRTGLADLRAELHRVVRVQTLALVTAMVGIAGITAAAG